MPEEIEFNWTIGAALSYEEEVAGKYAHVERGITNRFSGDKITAAETLETSGAHTLVTPAPGRFLTVYWVAIVSSQENTGEVLATIKVGSQTNYEWYLGNPGAFMHWEPLKGQVNDALTVTLSGAQKVAVSYTYSESVS